MDVIIPKKRIVEDTISELINQLDKRKINYAIMRNYENFPSVGNDLDLVIDPLKLDEFRKLAIELASQFGWEHLTECSHWSGSKVDAQNINVFRYYRLTPREGFQIDLFHGFLLWGIPLFNANQLLIDRKRDRKDQFYTISELYETVIKIFQIAALIKASSDSKKINRYLDKVKDYYKRENQKLCHFIRTKFNVDDCSVIDMLIDQKFDIFKQKISEIKRLYIYQIFKKQKLELIPIVFNRIIQLANLYFFDPCGFLVKVYGKNSANWDVLKKVLSEFKNSKLLYTYLICKNDYKCSKLNVQKILERGGIVFIEVQSESKSDLNIDNCNENDIAEFLYSQLVSNHKKLYSNIK
jgi:hypothetical protein